MKHLPKITLVFMLLFFISITSCGDDKDEETGPDLSEAALSFDAGNLPVDNELISNLLNETDQNAQLAASQLSLANGISAWLAIFSGSEGATTSSIPVGSCGGDALVYTYSYTIEGETTSIVYQVCELSTKYVFQIFISLDGSDLEQYIYAEESKSELKEGYMEVNDIFTPGSSEALLVYRWKENSDNSFDFTIEDPGSDFVVSMKLNADDSGYVEYRFDGVLEYRIEWTTDGSSGTYTYYDSDGSIASSGSWG